MRFVSFLTAAGNSFGLVDGEMVRDCAGLGHDDLAGAIAYSSLGEVAAAAREARAVPLSALTLLPVIPAPGKVFCVGLNYERHRLETGRGEAAYPTIFTRFADSQVGHGGAMIKPYLSDHFDFEGELAVVIGRGGRHIGEDAAMEHVAGYACYNDGSLRDFQGHSHQYTPGKNFPATGGFGPWLVTADAFVPGEQHIRTRLNGDMVQDARLSDMIFGIPRIIAYLSSFTRLLPGDVIATGTPGGVGAKRVPPLWLREGDRVEVEIEGIGTLFNTVALEPHA